VKDVADVSELNRHGRVVREHGKFCSEITRFNSWSCLGLNGNLLTTFSEGTL